MSRIDVGDAIELTFTTNTGATVTVSWLDPDQVPAVDAVTVAENPAGSGEFPYTFVATAPGVWTALFTASGAATQVQPYYVRASSVDGPPPLAVLGDVTEVYGTLTTAQEGLVWPLLRKASAMIRNTYPDLADRIAAGTLDSDTVAHAVTNMVLRVIRNPHAIKSETVGPFTRTFDVGAAAGLLAITAAETALLAVKPATRTRARSILLTPGLAPSPYGNLDVSRW